MKRQFILWVYKLVALALLFKMDMVWIAYSLVGIMFVAVGCVTYLTVYATTEFANEIIVHLLPAPSLL